MSLVDGMKSFIFSILFCFNFFMNASFFGPTSAYSSTSVSVLTGMISILSMYRFSISTSSLFDSGMSTRFIPDSAAAPRRQRERYFL